jgi:hypothetical protein
MADSVEKVLAAIGPNFLRAAGAFYGVRHGGLHRPKQNLSATFFFA